ncbi:hypothetical protein EMIT079MI2_350009 [Bacillus sp. IT-79MI2]
MYIISKLRCPYMLFLEYVNYNMTFPSQH